MLLLPRERASLCRGGADGGIFDPLASGRLATAETQTPLGTHIQRGQAGQVRAGHQEDACRCLLNGQCGWRTSILTGPSFSVCAPGLHILPHWAEQALVQEKKRDAPCFGFSLQNGTLQPSKRGSVSLLEPWSWTAAVSRCYCYCLLLQIKWQRWSRILLSRNERVFFFGNVNVWLLCSQLGLNSKLESASPC